MAFGDTVIGKAVIDIIPNVQKFSRALRDQLRSASRELRRLNKEIRPAASALRSMSRYATGLTYGVRLAAAALASLAATSVVGGIIAAGGALLTMSGALLTVPAAAVAAGDATLALGVGLFGVQDALKKFPKGAEQFNEKLKDLSKNAQSTLGVLEKFRGRITAFRNAVQDALFAGLAQTLTGVINKVLPIVQQHFVDLARIFNSAARELGAFVQQASTLKDLRTIAGNVTRSFATLRTAVRPVAQAILDLVTVGSGQLPYLATVVKNVATQFANFISRARASGQLQVWMRDGINALLQLGRIASNVGATLHSIFKTAQVAGLGFLNMLEQLTGKIRAFFESAQGQAQLINFLQQANQAAATLLPIIGALASLLFNHLLPVLNAVGHAIGPALTVFIRALGVALDAAAPGIVAFANGFATFIRSLAPALPAIGQLIGSLGTLVGALSGSLGPAVATVATIIASVLTPVFNALAVIIGLIPAPVFTFAAALAAVLASVIGVIGVLKVLISFARLAALSMSFMAVAATALSRGLALVTGFLKGPWGIALLAGIALLTTFALSSSNAGEAQSQAAQQGKELNQMIREQNGVITDNIRQRAAQQLEEDGALKLAEDLGIATNDLTTAYINQGGQLDALKASLAGKIAGENLVLAAQNASTDAHAREVIEAAKLLHILNQLSGGRDADSAATGRQQRAQQTAGDAITDTNAALQAQKEALDKVTEAQNTLNGNLLSLFEAETHTKQGFDTLTAGLTKNGTSFKTNTQAGIENRNNLTAWVRDINTQVDAMRKQGKGMGEVSTFIAAQRAQLINHIVALGGDKRAAEQVANALGLIPGNYVANTKLTGYEAIIRKAHDLNGYLDFLARTRTINIRYNVSGNAAAAAGAPIGGHPFAASGGDFNPGDFAVVGEKGPELVAFGRAARVFSHKDSIGMTSSSDKLTRLNRMTSRSLPRTTYGSAGSAVTATPVSVAVQPEVHVYVGNEAVDQHVERVVVKKDRHTQRVIRSRAYTTRGGTHRA